MEKYMLHHLVENQSPFKKGIDNLIFFCFILKSKWTESIKILQMWIELDFFLFDKDT